MITKTFVSESAVIVREAFFEEYWKDDPVIAARMAEIMAGSPPTLADMSGDFGQPSTTAAKIEKTSRDPPSTPMTITKTTTTATTSLSTASKRNASGSSTSKKKSKTTMMNSTTSKSAVGESGTKKKMVVVTSKKNSATSTSTTTTMTNFNSPPLVIVQPGNGGIVYELNDHDVCVLKGPVNGTKNPGNVAYNKLLEENIQAYFNAKSGARNARAHIAARVVGQVREGGGRFLKDHPSTAGAFVEIGDEKAFKKTQNAFIRIVPKKEEIVAFDVRKAKLIDIYWDELDAAGQDKVLLKEADLRDKQRWNDLHNDVQKAAVDKGLPEGEGWMLFQRLSGPTKQVKCHYCHPTLPPCKSLEDALKASKEANKAKGLKRMA